jgi:flagellar protein FliO/FliZ
MQHKTIVILDSILSQLKTTPIPAANDTESKVAAGVSHSVSTWDSFIQMLGLVILLIVILIAAYYTTKFIGGMKQGQLKHSNFQVIDAYRIGPNKAIEIVKIANKYVVIAIGKDSINYITELDEAEVFIKSEQGKEAQSFTQTLDKLRNGFNPRTK